MGIIKSSNPSINKIDDFIMMVEIKELLVHQIII